MLKAQEISPAGLLAKRMRFHPVRVWTYLILLGITSAFLTLVSSYFGSTAGSVWNQFSLPAVFHTNTIIILISSYSALQMRQAYLRGDQTAYRQALMATAFMGVCFTAFQILGWTELQRQGIGLRNNIGGTYLYLISALHLLHLLVGVALLLWFLIRAYLLDSDAVSSLLFETDPVAKLKVEMLGVYWHFVDGLWLFLYICFLVAIYVIPRSWDGWINPF